MISSNDFRSGVSIELDGAVWRVIEFLHVKPGKGAAFVRTKLKNAQTGNVMEKTFRAGESVPQAVLEKNVMQFTYKDGDKYVFMDMTTFEESLLTKAQIGEQSKYLKEGMDAMVVQWGDRILEVELPNSVVLEVVQTDPGVKGDTATGGTKPATVETGAEVMVPLFITIGEKIKIDTRDNKYLGREKDYRECDRLGCVRAYGGSLSAKLPALAWPFTNSFDLRSVHCCVSKFQRIARPIVSRQRDRHLRANARG